MDESRREDDSKAPGSAPSEGQAGGTGQGGRELVATRIGGTGTFEVVGNAKTGRLGQDVQKSAPRVQPKVGKLRAAREQPTTFRQRKFVKAYLANGGNKTDAYLATLVANSRKKITRKQAHDAGLAMFRSAGVQYLMDAAENRKDVAIAPVLAKYAVTQERIVEEFAKIAFADPRDIMSWNDEGVVVKPSDTLTPGAAGTISEIQAKSGKSGKSVKVKQYDKVAALVALAKIMGLQQEQPKGPSMAVQFVIQGKDD